MTIKELKGIYADYVDGGTTRFTVYTDSDFGKVLVIVGDFPQYGKSVEQVVRVSDGKELLKGCRPCDNMTDAIDVASEMLQDAKEWVAGSIA